MGHLLCSKLVLLFLVVLGRFKFFFFSRSSPHGNTASKHSWYFTGQKSERTFLCIGRRQKLLEDKKLAHSKAITGGYLSLAATSTTLLYLALIQVRS